MSANNTSNKDIYFTLSLSLLLKSRPFQQESLWWFLKAPSSYTILGHVENENVFPWWKDQLLCISIIKSPFNTINLQSFIHLRSICFHLWHWWFNFWNIYAINDVDKLCFTRSPHYSYFLEFIGWVLSHTSIESPFNTSNIHICFNLQHSVFVHLWHLWFNFLNIVVKSTCSKLACVSLQYYYLLYCALPCPPPDTIYKTDSKKKNCWRMG